MSKADNFIDHEEPFPTAGCPALSLWGELVAGLISGRLAGRLLDHAAQCPSCGEELRFAYEAIRGPSVLPEEIRQRLITASEAWQKNLARKIAAREIREIKKDE